MVDAGNDGRAKFAEALQMAFAHERVVAAQMEFIDQMMTCKDRDRALSGMDYLVLMLERRHRLSAQLRSIFDEPSRETAEDDRD